MLRINRNAMANATEFGHPLGVLGEFAELKIPEKHFVSCGAPQQGVLRCPFADECLFPCKGKEGKRSVINVDALTYLPVTVDAKGARVDPGTPGAKLERKDRPAGGPQNALIQFQHTDGGYGLKVMPCYRYMKHKRRWDKTGTKHYIQACEGDGQVFQMEETRRRTNPEGKIVADIVHVPRAVPFHPRPEDVMPFRRQQLKNMEKAEQDELRSVQARLQPLAQSIPFGESDGAGKTS